MNLSRRGFLSGLGAALAAPVVVKAEILMPIKRIIPYSGGIIDEINWYAPVGLYRGSLTATQWQHLGALITHELNTIIDRPSFMRSIMKFADVRESDIPMIKVRRENVNATFS